LGSFDDFPATLLVTAEFDILRDEGEELCRKIFQSMGTIRCYRHNGMPHGYLSYSSLEIPHWDILYQSIADMKSIFWN